MKEHFFSWYDLLAGPLWLAILYFIAFLIARYRYKDPFLRKHFMWGLTVKFIGCLGFIYVYGVYYPNGGDTFSYFRGARQLHDIIFTHPVSLWESLSSNTLDIPQQMLLGVDFSNTIWLKSASYIVIRFAFLFSLFTGNSYVAISLCFAFASFLGVWAFYRVVARLFPEYYKVSVAPVLYIPSVFLWGSGLMKDTIVIGFVGTLTYGAYYLFFCKRKVLLNSAIIIVCLYVLTTVKQYVLFAYLPALILWISLGPINRIPRNLKWLIVPLMLLFALVILALLFPLMEQYSEQYALDNVINTASGTAEYIYRTTREGGSNYSLGNISYTPLGLLKVFPLAVNVTLFRPYLFEIRNPVMLFSAVESTVVFIFTIWVLLRVGIFKYFKYLNRSPFLIMCLVFSVFFSFAVGLSTFNFGSLVRYKIPALPFYGIALIIPYFMFLREKRTSVRDPKGSLIVGLGLTEQ